MQRLSGLLGPLVLLGLASLGYGLGENEPCTNPDGDSGKCIYFRECEPMVKILHKPIISAEERSFVSQSQCGKTAAGTHLVCCVVSANNSGGRSELPKPPNCGADLSDRIFGGQTTNLDEQPWTALIEYRKTDGTTGFHCGASLINSRYVVTAAHCFNADKEWQPIGVRLGEWDLNSEQDCVNGECTDVPVDMGIERIIVHENYEPKSKAQYNDIALIRLTRDVRFSSFISPICLPIDNVHRLRNNVGTKTWAVGWGKTETLSQSNVKLKVELQIQDPTSCGNIYRQSGVTLRDTQMCAGGVRGQDTCTGDSGGPLTKLIGANTFLYGIVSVGPSKCGTKDVPGIYTNVAKYIDWIESNIQ